MITYNPSLYASDDLRDDKFYKDLLSSLGIPAGLAVISPFIANSQYSVATGQDLYFDMANPSSASIAVGAQNSRVLLHGSFYSKVYCSAFVGAGNVNAYLASGPNNNLAHWPVVGRAAVAAVDANITKDLEYNYDSVAFNYLRMSVSGGNLTFTWEVIFNGVKITY
jgi:hypothetical protein